jgi:polysaccharide deacetylase family protein (PEP-CTERM system associated)
VRHVVTRVEGKRPFAGRPSAAFTLDVEDWYQSSVDHDAPITERVVRNVDRVLALLDECGVKATFFVQGLVAEKFPGLVRELVAGGHEVQSHGYSHRPLFEMDRGRLRTELLRARAAVEDAAGTPVTAFRAQDFSVVACNLSALDVLADVGFTVDSSIFPMAARRYGIRGWELGPHRIALPSGRTLLEVPVAVWETRGWRVPVAGGGYFRMLPLQVLEHGIERVVESGRPAILYGHPYEFNPSELREYAARVPRSLRLSQGFGRRSFGTRVRSLLRGVPFGRMDELLRAWGVA